METYDVTFTPDGIELYAADDNGDSYHVRTIPHIPASEALASGDYDFPHQERDIDNYMMEQGYSILGNYVKDTIAIAN